MNNRFKFRVWHKKRKKIYEVLHLHTETWSNGGAWVTAKGFNIITQQDIHINIEPSDCVLMQCTGLKDKNGKLIYEGDVVEDVLMNKFVCNFDERYLSFLLRNIKNQQSMVFYPNINIEVIGNIYTDAHLLQECE